MTLDLYDIKSTSNKRKKIDKLDFVTMKSFVFWYSFAHSQTCHIILLVPFSFSLEDIHPTTLHPSIDKIVNFLEMSMLIKLKLKVIFKTSN